MSSDMGEYGGFEFSPSFNFETPSGGFSAGGTNVPAYSGFSGGGGMSGGATSFGGFSGGSGGESFGATPGIDFGEAFADPTSSASGAQSSFGERFGDWGPWGGDFSPGSNVSGQERNPFDTGTNAIPYGDMQWATGGLPPSSPPSAPDMGYNAVPFQDIRGVPGWDQPVTGGASREVPGLPGVSPPTDFSAQRAPSWSPPPPAGTGGGGGAKGGGTFLDRLTEGVISGVTKNPLGIISSGAGLAMNMLKGNKDPEGLEELRSAAAGLKNTGDVLRQYLTTGTLPAGMQASVDAATKAAKASIIQRHAARGLPTDPSKNSALQQELAQLEQNAIITGATLGDKLMTQGISASGISSQLYQAIMNLDRDRSKQTSQAIANFAAALGGGGGGNTTKGTLTFG